MLNLSALARQNTSFSLKERWDFLLDPDIYLADRVADFKGAGPALPFSWIKKFRLPLTAPRVYIILHNVRVTSIDDPHLNGGWYTVEDQSGLSVMNWSGHGMLGKLQSPLQAAHAQGFEDGDVVHEVFFQYLIEQTLPSIITITKHPRTHLPVTAVEHLRAVTPLLVPCAR